MFALLAIAVVGGFAPISLVYWLTPDIDTSDISRAKHAGLTGLPWTYATVIIPTLTK